jgi:hypothetical protein
MMQFNNKDVVLNFMGPSGTASYREAGAISEFPLVASIAGGDGALHHLRSATACRSFPTPA